MCAATTPTESSRAPKPAMVNPSMRIPFTASTNSSKYVMIPSVTNFGYSNLAFQHSVNLVPSQVRNMVRSNTIVMTSAPATYNKNILSVTPKLVKVNTDMFTMKGGSNNLQTSQTSTNVTNTKMAYNNCEKIVVFPQPTASGVKFRVVPQVAPTQQVFVENKNVSVNHAIKTVPTVSTSSFSVANSVENTVDYQINSLPTNIAVANVGSNLGAIPKTDDISYKNPFDYTEYVIKKEISRTIRGDSASTCSDSTQVNASQQIITTSKNKWMCLICSTIKEDKESLIEHYEFHKKTAENSENKNVATEVYECPACSQQAFSLNAYYRHIRLSHGERTYFCKVCNVSLQNPFTLSIHNFKKHSSDSELLTCCVCKTFSCAADYTCDLKDHIRINHSTVECKECKESFSSLDWLNEHKIFHENVVRFQCKMCNLVFDRSRLWIAHNKEHHAGDNVVNETAHKCDACNIFFADNVTYSRHNTLTHLDQGHLCFVCGKKFEKESNLKLHLQIHAGVKNFTCIVCGQSFLRAGALKIHARTHNGERPHKCLTCGKCFSQRSPLITHQRIHTGERPYVCDTCKGGYISKSALNTHRKTCKGLK